MSPPYWGICIDSACNDNCSRSDTGAPLSRGCRRGSAGSGCRMPALYLVSGRLREDHQAEGLEASLESQRTTRCKRIHPMAERDNGSTAEDLYPLSVRWIPADPSLVAGGLSSSGSRDVDRLAEPSSPGASAEILANWRER